MAVRGVLTHVASALRPDRNGCLEYRVTASTAAVHLLSDVSAHHKATFSHTSSCSWLRPIRLARHPQMSFPYNLTSTSPRTSRDRDDLLEAGLHPSLDLAFLDEMDPNIVDGFHLFYEREVPLELRTYDGTNFPTEVGNVENLRVKVLLLGDDKQPDAIRVELTSESNLFFHFLHDMSYEDFTDMQESQRLMVEFYEYPKLLTRLLSACLKESQQCLGLLYFNGDKTARLDFVQNMQHKFVELLRVRFVESNEDTVRRQITYRYNTIKSRSEILGAKLADFSAMLKIKNPSLLLQMRSRSLSNTSASPTKKTFRP